MRIGFEIDEVKEHRFWFRRFGIVMMIIGIAAVVSPVIGSPFLAWLLVLAGTCQLTHSFARERWSGRFLNRPSGILCFLAGLLMVSDPAMDMLLRARMLGLLLITIGVTRLFVALSIPLGHHSWLVSHALVAIISGISIWNSWPVSGFWLISVLVGSNMMIEGATEIALASGKYG
jgi:uncharacterized membrane protein HdeD (DUF308 family)